MKSQIFNDSCKNIQILNIEYKKEDLIDIYFGQFCYLYNFYHKNKDINTKLMCYNIDYFYLNSNLSLYLIKFNSIRNCFKFHEKELINYIHNTIVIKESSSKKNVKKI